MKNFTFIESVSQIAVGKMVLLPYLQDAFNKGASFAQASLVENRDLSHAGCVHPTVSSPVVIRVSSSDLGGFLDCL